MQGWVGIFENSKRPDRHAESSLFHTLQHLPPLTSTAGKRPTAGSLYSGVLTTAARNLIYKPTVVSALPFPVGYPLDGHSHLFTPFHTPSGCPADVARYHYCEIPVRNPLSSSPSRKSFSIYSWSGIQVSTCACWCPSLLIFLTNRVTEQWKLIVHSRHLLSSSCTHMKSRRVNIKTQQRQVGTIKYIYFFFIKACRKTIKLDYVPSLLHY